MEHTYAIGDRVAYVEPGRSPNGYVMLGTVDDLVENTDLVYVKWDDRTVDGEPWSPIALHPVTPRS